MLELIRNSREIIVALTIFTIMVLFHLDFYNIVILLLELIVLIEVAKMIFDFFEKRRIRLRYVLDGFIIFIIRDVVILLTNKEKRYDDILFMLFVIFILFVFRIMALKIGPSEEK